MVLAIAHRGARSLAPENTLPAIKKAWEVGADVVEIDVTVTRDGALVLLHDNTLVRTTDVNRCFPDRRQDPCCAFRLEEIRFLDAGSWFARDDPFGTITAGDVGRDELSSFQGIAVPTLDEVLEFVQDRLWRVNIEIKKTPPPMVDFPMAEAVLNLIEHKRIPAQCVIISSFEHEVLRTVRARRPDIEINALIGRSAAADQDWGGFEFSIYNADADATDEAQITKAHEHGCLVNLYTINNPNEMRRFIRAGVRGLFTDFPQILVDLLRTERRTGPQSPSGR